MYGISRMEGPSKLWFSQKLGRDYGCPTGGWSPDLADASKFNDESAAADYMKKMLPHDEPFCKVEAIDG